ncbi:MAG: hypothetical protein ACRC0V_10795 [Fusobacteriaceae bacterium]
MGIKKIVIRDYWEFLYEKLNHIDKDDIVSRTAIQCLLTEDGGHITDLLEACGYFDFDEDPEFKELVKKIEEIENEYDTCNNAIKVFEMGETKDIKPYFEYIIKMLIRFKDNEKRLDEISGTVDFENMDFRATLVFFQEYLSGYIGGVNKSLIVIEDACRNDDTDSKKMHRLKLIKGGKEA